MTGLPVILAEDANATLGPGLVRVPLDVMAKLDLQSGQTVRISGGRDTYGRVMPMKPGARTVYAAAGLIRNAQINPGDTIQIAPTQLSRLSGIMIEIEGSAFPGLEHLQEGFYDVPVTEGDVFEIPSSAGSHVTCTVVSASPANAGMFCDQTVISLSKPPEAVSDYEDVGGLETQIARVHEMVAGPLLRPDLFERLGIAPPRGVLFTGPPGSGKTLLARAIAERTSAAFFQINGPEIVSKHYGDSEQALRKVFTAASQKAPSIVFIDEIDAIAPKRSGLSDEKQVERRIVAQLLTLMDGLSERGQIIVMAATNLPDSLDPALRRPGRFDREVAFTPPDVQGRLDILKIHLKSAPLAADVDLMEIAAQCHGYVGADLAALAREASLAALDRAQKAVGGEAHLRVEDVFIEHKDLLAGAAQTQPSNLRDTFVDSAIVRWDDIGGYAAQKAQLTEAVIWPRQHADAFASLGLTPTRGILLSGPPGTGKTYIARALAHESGLNFVPVRPARIMSQFLGEAERAIAEIFHKARQSSPCLVFFDELDALAPPRQGKDAVLDRIVAQMLTEIDGVARNDGVVILAATNRPSGIDPALTRPGRFDLAIPIPLPDQDARRAILEVHCASRPCGADVDLDALAARTTDMSGAALASLVTAAARHALRRSLETQATVIELQMIDLERALRAASVSQNARQSNHLEGAA